MMTWTDVSIRGGALAVAAASLAGGGARLGGASAAVSLAAALGGSLLGCAAWGAWRAKGRVLRGAAGAFAGQAAFLVWCAGAFLFDLPRAFIAGAPGPWSRRLRILAVVAAGFAADILAGAWREAFPVPAAALRPAAVCFFWGAARASCLPECAGGAAPAVPADLAPADRLIRLVLTAAVTLTLALTGVLLMPLGQLKWR